MKVYPIISTTSSVKPAFKSNPSLRLQAARPLAERGPAVLQYIKKGCPKTKEGEKLFSEMFTPEIYDLYTMCLPVEDILAKCGDNLEVIERALGKYGLELYGQLPQGSTIENKYEGIAETGYWSKYDDLNTNFMNYLLQNPSGKLEQLRERFGNHAPMWLRRHESTGQIITGLFTYKVIDDLGDISSVAIEAQTLRSNAIRRYLDRAKQ